MEHKRNRPFINLFKNDVWFGMIKLFIHRKKGKRHSRPRDVTYHTLPGWEKLNYSRPGRV
jgi:hypothetical protein